MPLPYFSAQTDVGLTRKNNEDSILENPTLKLWAVADGMGGHASGEIASAIANSTIEEAVSLGASLPDAIQQAHKAVLKQSHSALQYRGMGSTLVAVQSSGNQYQIAWVGDSRAYLWSSTATGNQLEQLTTDHSYVQMLYQSGAISADQMASHPERNVITQCLGSLEMANVTVDSLDREWNKDDWLLLCSDGLTDGVNDQHICDILSASNSIPSAVEALMQAALDAGGKDNISILIVSRPPTAFNRILRAFGV